MNNIINLADMRGSAEILLDGSWRPFDVQQGAGETFKEALNRHQSALGADVVRSVLTNDDLVKLIGETIDNTISFGSIRTKWFAGHEDTGIKTIATAVLSKLRAQGVVR